MTEPSITCISCNRTSYSPGDVQHRYCVNCHSEHQGSIIWRAEQDPTVITGYVGAAQMFRITALEERRFTLGTARLTGIFYEQSGRYDTGPNAFPTADGAKEWASILMARLVRKMFFSKPPTMGTSGGEPVTEELVQRLAIEAEAGYDEAQLVPRIRKVLQAFDDGEIDVEQLKEYVEKIKQSAVNGDDTPEQTEVAPEPLTENQFIEQITRLVDAEVRRMRSERSAARARQKDEDDVV